MKPYFITGLPRSRTAWLANLLTWGDSFCFHEATTGCSSMEQLKATLETVPIGTRHIGNSDPNLGLIAQSIMETFPQCRVVLIHRPLEECVDAEFNAMTWEGLSDFDDVTKAKLTKLMREASLGMAHLARSLPAKRVLMVGYSDLDDEGIVRGIWNFCVPNTPFPTMRYRMLQNLRVTQIFKKVLRQYPEQPFRKLIESKITTLNESVLEKERAYA